MRRVCDIVFGVMILAIRVVDYTFRVSAVICSVSNIELRVFRGSDMRM